MKQHPLSAAFPAMPEREYLALRDSIESVGVLNPITTFKGMVLDGWHRFCAARDLGMPCPQVELEAGVDPRDFVLAQNKARRHITQAQLAMAATDVYAWMSEGRPCSATQNSAGPAELAAGLAQKPAKPAKEIAKAVGVGTRTVEQAKKVKTRAIPEVLLAVRSGKVGLEKASLIADLAPEQQAEAIDKPVKKKLIESSPSPSHLISAKSAPIERDHDGASMEELVDELHADVRKAEDRASAAEAVARELEDAMKGDGDTAKIATLIRRCEHAERRVKELMDTTAQLQKARDFYMRQLTRIGKAIGERDLDRIVPGVLAKLRVRAAA